MLWMILIMTKKHYYHIFVIYYVVDDFDNDQFSLRRALPHICRRPESWDRDAELARSIPAIWRNFVRHFLNSSRRWAYEDCIIIKIFWRYWIMINRNESTLNIFRDCRVVRDPQTLKSKGYGFVSFMKKVNLVIKTYLLETCKKKHEEQNMKKVSLITKKHVKNISATNEWRN